MAQFSSFSIITKMVKMLFLLTEPQGINQDKTYIKWGGKEYLFTANFTANKQRARMYRFLTRCVDIDGISPIMTLYTKIPAN
jgi:hypothetical protein